MFKLESLTFNTDPTLVELDDLANLYEAVGFGEADDYNSDPAFISKIFGPGAYGFFAFDGQKLIAMARALSDDRITTWIAEICVHPDWRSKGIGKEIMRRVSERFEHTALYLEAFNGQVDFFTKSGVRPKMKLVACSRGPILRKRES